MFQQGELLITSMRKYFAGLAYLAVLVCPLSSQQTDTNYRNLAAVTFSQLGAPADGAIIYCSDCTATNPTTGGGSGAVVKRENGVWNGGNTFDIGLEVSFGTADSSGPILSAGIVTGYVVATSACTLSVAGISNWYIVVDGGSATVKMLKITAGTSKPVYPTNNISTAGWSISTGTAVENTNMSDLTTLTINRGDIIGFYISATSNVRYIKAGVTCQN